MKKLLDILSPIIFIGALILVIGAPGAVDAGDISLGRAMVQMLIGLGVIAAICIKEKVWR